MPLFDPNQDVLKRKAPTVAPIVGGGGPAYTPPVQAGSYASPGPTPSPSISIGQSFTPNYEQLIQSDPGYVSAMSNSSLDVNQAASARRAALRQLAIQYGGLPKGMQDVYGDIDQGTLDLASRNQFSDVARLGKSYSEGVDQFKKALAARGALQSGELGYGLSQADYSRGEREYDLGNQFANAAQGTVNDFVGAESRARQGQVDAINQAQANVFANPLNRPVNAQSATLEPGSLQQYGQPLYRGPDGQLYTLSGQVFTGGGGGYDVSPDDQPDLALFKQMGIPYDPLYDVVRRFR